VLRVYCLWHYKDHGIIDRNFKRQHLEKARSNIKFTVNQRQLGKNWCNKHRGRCYDMTSFSSTTPASLQMKLCKAPVRWRCPQQQGWRFWWQRDSYYSCCSRSFKEGQLTGQTNSNIHQFNGDMTGKRQNLVCHVNRDLTPYIIFMSHFTAVIIFSVEETSWCYQQYLDLLTIDFSCTWCHWLLKGSCFWWSLFRWDMT
jgi:hypothetical protein